MTSGCGRRVWLCLTVVWTFGLAGCGVPGSVGQADTYGLDFSLPSGSQTAGALIFAVDGVNAEVFQQMLQAGELPAIRKYFVDRGLYCPRAVAVVPSVTLPSFTSVVTGRLPGHHGVTGVDWFDRQRVLYRDYCTISQKNALDGDYTAPTIYEQFPRRSTFSVFLQPHRGATTFIEQRLTGAPTFFFRWYEFLDRLTLLRLGIVLDAARLDRAFPAVTAVYLLAPDFAAYCHGVDSPQYRQALRHTDRQIGRVLGDVARAGLLDKVHLALVSDHGMTQAVRHFDVAEFLRRQVGLKLASRQLWESTPPEQRLQYYQQYQVVSYGSGRRYVALCLRKPIRKDSQIVGMEPWPIRPTPQDLERYPSGDGLDDLPSVLAAQEAFEALAYAAGPNRVRVRTKAGEVEFRQDAGPGGEIVYLLRSGTDPLGYKAEVPPDAMDGAPMDERQWLAATADTDYPDLPAQILAYFRAPRAGDIIVFAAPGWDFDRSHKAGHGGVSPADMYVPLLLAGPGVPHSQVHHARTVDLMPTLLVLLSRPVPPGLDGRSLLPAPAPADTQPRPPSRPTDR